MKLIITISFIFLSIQAIGQSGTNPIWLKFGMNHVKPTPNLYGDSTYWPPYFPVEQFQIYACHVPDSGRLVMVIAQQPTWFEDKPDYNFIIAADSATGYPIKTNHSGSGDSLLAFGVWWWITGCLNVAGSVVSNHVGTIGKPIMNEPDVPANKTLFIYVENIYQDPRDFYIFLKVRD